MKAPMTRLLLIRHGSPHEGHPSLPCDPPLDAPGHRHARRLAKALANVQIDRIVRSPQRRARDTATPLAELLGLEVEIVEGVAEVDRHATTRYRSAATIRREEPHRWAEFSLSPARSRPLCIAQPTDSPDRRLASMKRLPDGGF